MTIEGTERIFEPSLVTVVDHETEVPPRLEGSVGRHRSTASCSCWSNSWRENGGELTADERPPDRRQGQREIEAYAPFTEVCLDRARR